jgi:hypothetical protein
MSRVVVLGVVVLAACGASQRPTAPPPEDAATPRPTPAIDDATAAEFADAFMDVLTTMVQISRTDDCPTMGAQLRDLFERSQPLFDQTITLAADPDAAKRIATAMDARASKVSPLVDAMGPGLVRCREDPTVQDAMARMPTLHL